MSFRLRYFLAHLSASVVLAALLLLMVFGVWYPAPLDAAVGVTSIFLILLGVDVVIGPMLTFLVSKEFKKSLKFDLTIIIILQLSALIYGVYVVAQGRPVWLVFNGDRFDLVQAYQLSDNPHIAKAKPEYSAASLFGPKWVAARSPEGIEARNDLTFEAVFAGIDIPQRPDLYVPYDEEAPTVINKALPLSDLKRYNDAAAVEKVMAEWKQADAFLPLMSRVKSMTVLINKSSGEIIAVVNLNPWE